MGHASIIAKHGPDMTFMEDTVELYTHVVAAETHMLSDTKSQLGDSDAEINSVMHQAD